MCNILNRIVCYLKFPLIIGSIVIRFIFRQNLNNGNFLNGFINKKNANKIVEQDADVDEEEDDVHISGADKIIGNGESNRTSHRINSDTSHSSNESILTQSDLSSLNSTTTTTFKSEHDMRRSYLQMSPEYISNRRTSSEINTTFAKPIISLRSITPIPRHVLSQTQSTPYEEVERSGTPYIPGGARQKCIGTTRRGDQCRNAATIGSETCRMHSFTY